MTGIGRFAIVEDAQALVVGLGANPADQVMHAGEPFGTQESDLLQGLEVLNVWKSLQPPKGER